MTYMTPAASFGLGLAFGLWLRFIYELRAIERCGG